MKSVLVILALFAFVAAVFAACPAYPDPAAKYCQACIAAEAEDNGSPCGWCATSSFSSCSTNTTCGFLSGNFTTDTDECPAACTVDEDITTDYCEIDHDSFIPSKIASCRTVNSPEASTVTTGTVAATTSSCSISDDCIIAYYGYSCSSSCALCDVDDPEHYDLFTISQDQCDAINDACEQEIEDDCIQPIAAILCSEDEPYNPEIKATDEVVSGNAATTATASTATTSLSTATSQAATATTSLSTATSQAATATTALTTATSQAATATTAASTSATSTTRVTRSSASATIVSAFVALFVLLALF